MPQYIEITEEVKKAGTKFKHVAVLHRVDGSMDRFEQWPKKGKDGQAIPYETGFYILDLDTIWVKQSITETNGRNYVNPVLQLGDLKFISKTKPAVSTSKVG